MRTPTQHWQPRCSPDGSFTVVKKLNSTLKKSSRERVYFSRHAASTLPVSLCLTRARALRLSLTPFTVCSTRSVHLKVYSRIILLRHETCFSLARVNNRRNYYFYKCKTFCTTAPLRRRNSDTKKDALIISPPCVKGYRNGHSSPRIDNECNNNGNFSHTLYINVAISSRT